MSTNAKETRVVRGLEKGMELELRTYSRCGEVLFERCVAAESQRMVYFNVHKKNLSDQGKLQSGRAKSVWRVIVDAIFDNEKSICVYVHLPDPERISHEEFSVAGYTNGQEITVMVGSLNDDTKYILSDNRQDGIRIRFHIDEENEEQFKKLNSSVYGDKWLARVVFLKPPNDESRGQKTVHANIELLGSEPISKIVFDEFRTGNYYSVSVTINPQKVNQLCSIFRSGKKVLFCLDQEREDYKESREYLQTLKVGWNTRFTVTRAKIGNKEVVIYGYLNDAVNKKQKTTA